MATSPLAAPFGAALSGAPLQRSFDDLGPSLYDTTFCVIDLETTGGSPQHDGITEIGAVKVRGGECLGTFQTLVNPGCAVPPQITILTGITEAMVVKAPRVESVLPALLEFARDAVIVGHNVRFDVGFLNAALLRDRRPKLSNPILDTCALARRLVRDDVPNCKLDTLASRLRLDHRPSHRALDDALATVDLLHVLIERAGGVGVSGLDDLLTLPKLAGTAQLAKLRLTERLPRAPGVYLFRNAQREVIYVGKATNLRARVRSYFSTDSRRKVGNLLRELASIEHIECTGALEAAVVELRFIQQHDPRYNRAGRRRVAPVFVRLTKERYPRLTTTKHTPPPGEPAVGPIAPAHARVVIEAIEQAVPIRRCSARPERNRCDNPCAPAQLGVAACPCAGAITEEAYASIAQRVRHGLAAEPPVLLEPLIDRMRTLAAADRFEEAANVRDRAQALAGALIKQRRVRALASGESLVFDVRGEGRIEVRDGCLVTSRSTPSDRSALARFDETHLIAGWLERYHERISLVSCDGAYAEALPRIVELRTGAGPRRGKR